MKKEGVNGQGWRSSCMVRYRMWGQGEMFRTVRHLFLIALVVLFTVQFVGTVCSDDSLREWSHGPVHGHHDQNPAGTDGQTETDSSQGEGESELALAQGDGLHVLPVTGAGYFGSASCPRKSFISDRFRPPALT